MGNEDMIIKVVKALEWLTEKGLIESFNGFHELTESGHKFLKKFDDSEIGGVRSEISNTLSSQGAEEPEVAASILVSSAMAPYHWDDSGGSVQ